MKKFFSLAPDLYYDYRKMYRVSTIKIIAIISSSDIYYFIEI